MAISIHLRGLQIRRPFFMRRHHRATVIMPALLQWPGNCARSEPPNGRPYRLMPLPFPGIHLDQNGRRLPASYANFLIINHAVLLPTYGVPQDDEAKATIQEAFPDREIVTIDCRQIIQQNGSLHCLTMQFPATGCAT